jgi:hypothetical protein
VLREHSLQLLATLAVHTPVEMCSAKVGFKRATGMGEPESGLALLLTFVFANSSADVALREVCSFCVFGRGYAFRVVTLNPPHTHTFQSQDALRVVLAACGSAAVCELLVSLDGVRRLTELLVCEADPLASLGASLIVSMSAAKVSVQREREWGSNSTLLLAGGRGWRGWGMTA